jgi:non-haem dioxygenase in morphine synthesis N-terminal
MYIFNMNLILLLMVRSGQNLIKVFSGVALYQSGSPLSVLITDFERTETMRLSHFRVGGSVSPLPSFLNRCTPQVFISTAKRCLATVADPRETGFKIPIVDFGIFLKGGESEKNKCAKEILEGFKSSGFVYLGNAGLPKGVVPNIFSWSKKFFDMPMEEKVKLAWETPESNRGYVAPGREKVSRLLSQEDIEKIRASAPDLKESIEIGKEPSDNYLVETDCLASTDFRINGLRLYLNFMEK